MSCSFFKAEAFFSEKIKKVRNSSQGNVFFNQISGNSFYQKPNLKAENLKSAKLENRRILIDQAMKQFDSVCVSFKQKNSDLSFIEGRFVLKKPFFKAQYLPPAAPIVLETSGGMIVRSNPLTEEVDSFEIDKTPLYPLLQKESLFKKAVVTKIYNKYDQTGQYIFVEVRPINDPEGGRVTLLFKKVNCKLKLTGWMIRDAQERLTIVTFSKVESLSPQKK